MLAVPLRFVHRTGSLSYASRGRFQVTLIMMSPHEGWLSSKCLGCCDRYFLVVAWAPEFRQTPARRCSYPHQGIQFWILVYDLS